MLIRPNPAKRGVPPILWLLVGVMAAIELCLSLADMGMIANPGLRIEAFIHGAFWTALLDGSAEPVYAAQPFAMFVTHTLLHGAIYHFAMNGVILLALGKMICEQAGAGPMVLLFVVSGICGGAVFGLLSQAEGPMIGASGAVFGFLGLWQYWEAMARRASGLPLGPVLRTIVGLVVLNIVLAVVLRGQLAWEAHLGGFLGGFAIGPLMTHFARRHLSRTNDQR